MIPETPTLVFLNNSTLPSVDYTLSCTLNFRNVHFHSKSLLQDKHFWYLTHSEFSSCKSLDSLFMDGYLILSLLLSVIHLLVTSPNFIWFLGFQDSFVPVFFPSPLLNSPSLRVMAQYPNYSVPLTPHFHPQDSPLVTFCILSPSRN